MIGEQTLPVPKQALPVIGQPLRTTFCRREAAVAGSASSPIASPHVLSKTVSLKIFVCFFCFLFSAPVNFTVTVFGR